MQTDRMDEVKEGRIKEKVRLVYLCDAEVKKEIALCVYSFFEVREWKELTCAGKPDAFFSLLSGQMCQSDVGVCVCVSEVIFLQVLKSGSTEPRVVRRVVSSKGGDGSDPQLSRFGVCSNRKSGPERCCSRACIQSFHLKPSGFPLRSTQAGKCDLTWSFRAKGP